MAERRRILRSLSKSATTDETDGRDLRRASRGAAVVSIADAPVRLETRLRGTLRTVTLRPRGGVPALEADLYDGTASLTLVWLGRRRIAGIEPGRSLEIVGRIGVQDGDRIIYNPRYELR
ncbi:MAG: OB-fold nucleic acid binding domain-containing protein [Nocardioidaceae bacterium]|nr:OB-fold nucleic acid binding domain-containing protein [Nocardioidaceae bacterium]MCL2611818.1 OB-fold nucleic acid binding domain-containing protein [Nocardioidaceae bacterium]